MSSDNKRGHRNWASSHSIRRKLRLEALETRQLLATFTVSNLDDVPVAQPGDAPGTLRQAIYDANATSGHDEIVFQEGLTGELGLTAGQLVISDSVDLIGPGSDELTVNSLGGELAVSVESGDVSISGITVTGGDNLYYLYNSSGISNRGNLTIADSVVRDNVGGGIDNFNGSLTLLRTTVTGNSRFSGGAGIHSRGTLAVIDSTISDNSVVSTAIGTTANGGGIAFVGELTVMRSVITGNSVIENGGGIGSRSVSGVTNYLTIVDSDISDNMASGESSATGFGGGGGIYFFEGIGTIRGSTISRNEAPYGAGIQSRTELTVTDSTVTDNVGAGIFSQAGLTISNSRMSGNRPAIWAYSFDDTVDIVDSDISGNSGGISGYGDVTVTSSRITDNTTTHLGGGIHTYGDVSVTSSTITGNSASSGGGVHAAGDVTIAYSTISGNTTTFTGGGIHTWGNVSVKSSTISGNSATASGGGIYASGDVTIAYSTISDNLAVTGGGIYASSTSERLTVANSIVAANHGSAPDLHSGTSAVTVTYSLIGDNSETGLAEAPLGAPDGSGNLIGSAAGAGAIDPVLAPLADNGGPTWTHLLLPASPALNAGDASLAAGVGEVPEFDQRGPGFPRVARNNIDMGAVERGTADLSGWHNAANPLDVTGDGMVAPLDALSVINELTNRRFTATQDGRLAAVRGPRDPYLDVNDDEIVSPIDALLVINGLPSTSPQAALGMQVAIATVGTTVPGRIARAATIGHDMTAEQNADRQTARRLVEPIPCPWRAVDALFLNWPCASRSAGDRQIT